MAKNQIMILSDVHIGINAPTNWYQKKVHEDLLIASLQWAQKNDSLKELVILGDLVDFWTYKPDFSLPSLEEIVNENPNILGPSGELAKTVNVLGEGNVVYVNGNHDMILTPEMIKTWINPKIKTMPNGRLYYIPDFGKRTVYLTHGHIYSLLCAPDYVNPPESWQNLPLGYFLTRMSALLCEIEINELHKKNPSIVSAADLEGQGNPLGYSVLGILENIYSEWKSGGSMNLPHLVMDGLQPQPPNPMVDSINMPAYQGNPFDVTVNEVEKAYANLLTGMFEDPQSTYPNGSNIDPKYYAYFNNTKDALLALGDADVFDDLTVWADGLAVSLFTTAGEPVVALGHTHVPKLDDKYIFYTNAGFNCPAIPDMKSGKKAPTFSVIECDGDTTYKLYVNTVTLSLEVQEDTNPKVLSRETL